MASEQTIQQIQKLLSQLSSEIGVEVARAKHEGAQTQTFDMAAPAQATITHPPVEPKPAVKAVSPLRSTYTVRAGDTIVGIANKLGINFQELIAANPGINPDVIFIGQRLNLSRPSPAEATVALDGQTRVIRCCSPVDPNWPAPVPEHWIVALGYGQIYPPKYVQFAGKLHSGLDLNLAFDGDRGKPVYAIQDGQVGFAKAGKQGSLDGWGSLIAIKHDDGYISRYGHCISISVQAGDTVTQGQQIARIGGEEYGYANHLHFDIGLPGMVKWHAIDTSAYVNQAELDKHCIDPVTYFALRNGKSP